MQYSGMKLLAQGLVLTVPDRFHVVIIWSARKQKTQKMKKYGDVEKSTLLLSGYHADTPITIKAEASSKADSRPN